MESQSVCKILLVYLSGRGDVVLLGDSLRLTRGRLLDGEERSARNIYTIATIHTERFFCFII